MTVEGFKDQLRFTTRSLWRRRVVQSYRDLPPRRRIVAVVAASVLVALGYADCVAVVRSGGGFLHGNGSLFGLLFVTVWTLGTCSLILVADSMIAAFALSEGFIVVGAVLGAIGLVLFG